MSSIKAWPLMVIVFLVVIVYTGILVVGDESITNSNLDNRSIELIINLNSNFDANFNDLTLSSSNLSANTSFEGQDAFVQQYLESKESTGEIGGFVNKIVSIPDLLILGINSDIPEQDLAAFKLILAAFLIIVLAVTVFVALFGDGRIT